jgi:two-component system sensor histidine kinase FlrB
MRRALVCSVILVPHRLHLPDLAQLPSPKDLEQAFSLFNQASAQLATAYHDLEQQVARLTSELAVANGELRQQYQEKEALSTRLALLLEALPGGVVVLDAAGCVAQANPAALRMLGDAILREPWSDVEARRLAPAAEAREWQLRGRDGSLLERWVNVSASALDTAGGRILLLSDITEARGLREQLERHRRLSAMGEMAAGLAHQLRTPLATALLYAGNLARPQLPDLDRQRFAERVQARLRDLERMIQDMLTFVRGAPAAREAIDFAALLREVAQVMEPQTQAAGVSLQVQVDCGPARVLGQREALAGALLNLLENALQACAAGGEVRLEADAAAAAAVRVRVSDSGTGMEESVRARLFEPFFTTRSDGTGLGLAIVRTVVQAHGGEIGVRSSPGRGSEFEVMLPRCEEGGGPS